jgi:hypothetical protein
LLSARGGAEDLSDGTKLSVNNIRKREYHHLNPAAWLKDQGIEEEIAYRALNCILVTWKTNRVISAKEPIAYLKERCEISTLGEPEIRRRLETFFVNYDELAAGDYLRFLENKAKASKTAIVALCNGIVWKP